jgi:hypothetical protein
MQFMILFSWDPEKAQPPVAADLRESEFQTVRGLYTMVWFNRPGFAAMLAALA